MRCFARDEKIKKINKNRKGKQEVFIIKFTKIGGFENPPKYPLLGIPANPDRIRRRRRNQYLRWLIFSLGFGSHRSDDFFGGPSGFCAKTPFKRLFLREAEKSIGHFAPRSLPPGYYFLSIAFRHRARIERISKGSSIRGNVGTPWGSRKALPASMCFLSPVKVA